MLKIDNNLLVELGLAGLPDNDKNSFLKHIYETLEMRVGVRLADQMTNQQLDEFEQYFEAKDDAGAFKWLETNFPNYKDIVQQEFDKLKAEIAQQAPQILAASQANAAQIPAQPVAPAEPQAVAAPAPMMPPAPADPYAASAPAAPQPPAPAVPAVDPFAQGQPPIPPAAPAMPPAPMPDPALPQPPFPNQQPPAGPPAPAV